MDTHTHTHTCVHTTHKCTRTHIHTLTHIHTYTNTHTHTHAHTHTHTHTHTHIFDIIFSFLVIHSSLTLEGYTGLTYGSVKDYHYMEWCGNLYKWQLKTKLIWAFKPYLSWYQINKNRNMVCIRFPCHQRCGFYGNNLCLIILCFVLGIKRTRGERRWRLVWSQPLEKTSVGYCLGNIPISTLLYSCWLFGIRTKISAIISELCAS